MIRGAAPVMCSATRHGLSLSMKTLLTPKASKIGHACLLCVLLILASSCSRTEMTMKEFAKVKPFKGRVTKAVQIDSKNPPRSVSGPDFRVTVTKQDGSITIITRIATYLTTADRLQKLVEKAECDLPDEIVQCADKDWQETE